MRKKSMAVLLAAALLLQNAGVIRAEETAADPEADVFVTADMEGDASTDEITADADMADDSMEQTGEADASDDLPAEGLIEDPDAPDEDDIQLEAQEVWGGSGLSWSLSLGTLTVSGSGAMPECDYDFDEDEEYYEDGFPWAGLRNSITDIVVGDEVTSISGAAFWNCENLKSVTIGKNVRTIGDEAFFWDTALTSVTFNACRDEEDEALAALLPEVSLGTNAFDGCDSLVQVQLPAKTVSIGESAFDNCSSLAKITLGQSLKTIGETAFSGCSSLGKLEIPSTVSRIDSCAFEVCGEDTADGCLEIHFRGDFPVVFAEDVFSEASVTGFYPGGNETWTEEVRSKEYGAEKITWTPEGIDIRNCDISLRQTDYAYTGLAVYPDLRITYTDGEGNTRFLEEDTDYTVTSQSKGIGSAWAYVEGRGDFVGTEKVDFQIILMSKLVSELTLTWDSYTYRNGDIGDPLKMTLKLRNEPADKPIDEMTARDMNDVHLYLNHIDLTIAGTPVAYFSQSGDSYLQKETVVPLDDGLDLAVGEEKDLIVEKEILTNPPVLIDRLTQVGTLTCSIRGTKGGREVEVKEEKKITFKYELLGTESHYNFSVKIKDWVTNVGTQESISYLADNSNFIHCLYFADSDQKVGAHVVEFLSDLIFRGWTGRENLVDGVLEQQEAEQLLVDFLTESQESVELLAKAKECDDMAYNIAWGFRQFVRASGSKVLGVEISDFKEEDVIAVYEVLKPKLMNGDYGSLNVLTDEFDADTIKLFSAYTNSMYYAQKVMNGLKVVGTGMAVLGATAETVRQSSEIGKLEEANALYRSLLDYIAANCEHDAVRKAASRLSGIIQKNEEDRKSYLREGIHNAAVELGSDFAVSGAVSLAGKLLAGGAKGLTLSYAAAQAGFTIGVTLSNAMLGTSDQAKLRDQMEILYYLGSSIGNWVYDGVSRYTSGNRDSARQVAYGESMLIKTRRTGEKAYQRFCEILRKTDSEAYRVSILISKSLDQMDGWLESSSCEALSGAGFYCPVDVEVLDAGGNVVLTLRDGAAASGVSGNIAYECAKIPGTEDYCKIVVYPKSSRYQFRCTGVGQGTVFGYFSQFGADGLTRCRTFTDVPVNEGTQIKVPDPFNSDSYEVVDGDVVIRPAYDPTILPPAVGSTLFDASGNVYSVTKFGTVNGITGTVNFVRPGSSAAASAVIPDTISVGGITYRVTAIAAKAFLKNKKLKSVTIGANILTIGNEAFSTCAKLSKVTIGGRVAQIGAKAFFKCTALKKITIPASVSAIGAQAFFGCKKLKTITIQTTALTGSSVGAKAFKKTPANAKVKVPKAVLKAYQKLLKKKGLSGKARVKK